MKHVTRRITDPTIIGELKRLHATTGSRRLSAAALVAAARRKRSPLHGLFLWDDTEAAHEWRLHQARNIIRAAIEINPVTRKEVRVFVSLADEARAGGGYHVLADLLSDDELRARKLQQALREAEAWTERYRDLEELADVFELLGRIREGVLQP